MTKKSFLIPWLGVLSITLIASLFLNSDSAIAEEYRNQSSIIPTLNAFLSDQVEGGSSNAQIGDKINYTTSLILESDAEPLTDVVVEFNPDLSLSKSAEFDTTPLAYDDFYDLTIDSATAVPPSQGLLAPSFVVDGISKKSLAADQDFDASPNVTVVEETIVTAYGSVDLHADGGFAYTSNTAASTFTDTFTYTIVDGEGNTDTAYVQLEFTRDSSIIYVDSQATGSGNGSLSNPFASLEDGLAAADQACDIIFLFSSPVPYEIDHADLNDCQKLIGQDYGPASFVDITEIDEEVPAATSENRPTIQCSRFVDYLDGVDPSQNYPTTNQGCINLGTDNIVAGINVLNSGSTQKAIAGENFGTFWGFNISVENSDGFSMSCNDDGFHHMILTSDVNIDQYGYFGIDLASFGSGGANDCELSAHLTDVEITNSGGGAQEAVRAYAQSDEMLKLHLNDLKAENISKTVVRMTATHNGEAELNVQNAELSNFDSAGIYVENYVFWGEYDQAGFVDVTINDSVIQPNTNGRALMVNHQGRILSDLSITNNIIGEGGVDSDGLVIYANNEGSVSLELTDNQFLSRGAATPNLPSNLTHAPQVPIYFESNVTTGSSCIDASGNSAPAGYNFGTNSDQESLGLDIGSNSTMHIAEWDGSGNQSGAENAIESNNPALSGGADIILDSGANIQAGDCTIDLASVFQSSFQGAGTFIEADLAINIPVFPPGKTVEIYTSATVNENAVGEETVSNQAIIQASGGLEAKTVDPDPPAGLEDPDGRTVTPIQTNFPKLSIADVVVSEDAGQAQVTISLNKSSSQPIVIDYTTADGSAISGEDYLESAGSVIFDPGQTEKTISINIIDDQTTEDDEQFSINLALAAGQPAEIEDGEGIVTILANDEIVVIPDLIVEDLQVSEGVGAASISLSISEAIESDITIIYVPIEGTATAGTDFVDMAGEVLIPAGATTAEFSLSIIDDDEIEPVEAFRIEYQAKNGSNVAIPDPVSTVTITDNESATIPEAAADDVTVHEGSGTVTVTVYLQEAAQQDVGIIYQTFDGTAVEEEDYLPLTGSVIIPAGDLSADFTIEINEDDENEFIETFFVRLSAASSGAVFIKNPELVVSIVDNDDVLVAVGNFDGSPYRALEGQGSIQVSVSLSRASTETVQVTLNTADLSAIAGSDYVAIPPTDIVFAPNEVIKQVNVQVIDDADTNEPIQSFELVISNPQNALIGQETTQVAIIDNDALFPFAFVEFSDYSVFEDEDNNPSTVTELDIRVMLSNASANTITLTVGTVDGTANITDYESLQAVPVVIPAGETSATVSISIFEDQISERPETFSFFITSALNAQIDATQNNALITIADGSAPLLRIVSWEMNGRTLQTSDRALFKVEVIGNVVLPVRFKLDIFEQSRRGSNESQAFKYQPGTHEIELDIPLNLHIDKHGSGSLDLSSFYADVASPNGAFIGPDFDPIQANQPKPLNQSIFLTIIKR